MFMPFTMFPWFQDAPVAAILHVEQPAPGHLYWPTLDIDVAIESIEHPDRFPLVSRTVPPTPLPSEFEPGSRKRAVPKRVRRRAGK